LCGFKKELTGAFYSSTDKYQSCGALRPTRPSTVAKWISTVRSRSDGQLRSSGRGYFALTPPVAAESNPKSISIPIGLLVARTFPAPPVAAGHAEPGHPAPARRADPIALPVLAAHCRKLHAPASPSLLFSSPPDPAPCRAGLTTAARIRHTAGSSPCRSAPRGASSCATAALAGVRVV
jgi:hypothetical protein